MQRTFCGIVMVLAIALSGFTQQAVKERVRWVIPTYTVEVRSGAADDFSVAIEGTYTRPDGTVVEIDEPAARLPFDLHISADGPIEIKIKTMTTKPFRATVFYEHNNVMKWVMSKPCSNPDGVSLTLEPRGEYCWKLAEQQCSTQAYWDCMGER